MSRSAGKYSVSAATEADAHELAPKLRTADVQEIWAAARRTPLDALLSAVHMSGETALSGRVDGRVACMWGVAPASFLSDVYRPWLLASDEIVPHARTFLRLNRDWMIWASTEYPILENYVDARNEVSIRWLRWLGFDILPPEPMGPDRVPFHRFRMVSSCATLRL